MNNNSKILTETKERIDRFAIKAVEGVSRPRRKFLRQMIYGMQAARDVKVSEIARSLCEKIKLIKVENRLTRHLAKEDLTEILNRNLLKESGKSIGRDTVLAIDLSDIRKEFAKKMEHMDGIWDGSRHKEAKGYWICEIVGAEVNGNEVTPLYSKAYSQSATGFVSENFQILDAVNEVYEATKGNGILTMDRGGARPEIIENIDKKRRSFVIRMRGDRHVVDCRGNKQSLSELAKKTRCPISHEIEVNRDGKIKRYTICLGMRKDVLYAEVKLNIVVVRGFGDEEMILATNTTKTEKEILEIYLTRWKCEESFRFLKNEYNLEDVRVRSYIAIRNVVAILHTVFYFLSVELGVRLSLNIMFKKVMEKAKRFFEVTIFRQYALADGLGRMLFETGWQDMHPEGKNRGRQMTLKFGP
jgi:hypothetical protein